jgi:hypothetical protein
MRFQNSLRKLRADRAGPCYEKNDAGLKPRRYKCQPRAVSYCMVGGMWPGLKPILTRRLFRWIEVQLPLLNQGAATERHAPGTRSARVKKLTLEMQGW